MTWGVCTAKRVERSGVDRTRPSVGSAVLMVSVTGTAGAAALVRQADDLVKLRRVHQGPGGVVNGQKPRFGVCLHGGGQHGLGPGGAAQDHLDRLMQAAAAAQVRHGQQQILAGGHDDLVHQLCFVDGAEGAHQHRCAAQICQQLVLTAHAGGGPGGGDDGRAEGAGLILDPAQLIPKFSHSLTLPAS